MARGFANVKKWWTKDTKRLKKGQRGFPNKHEILGCRRDRRYEKEWSVFGWGLLTGLCLLAILLDQVFQLTSGAFQFGLGPDIYIVRIYSEYTVQVGYTGRLFSVLEQNHADICKVYAVDVQ